MVRLSLLLSALAAAATVGCVRVSAPDRIDLPPPADRAAAFAVEGLRNPPPEVGTDLDDRDLGRGGRNRDFIAGLAEAVAKDLLLGTRAGVFLAGRDAMIRPGDAVSVEALLLGSRLSGLAGHRVSFSVEGTPMGEALTDAAGRASCGIRFDRAGTYVVRIRWVAGPQNLGSVPSAEAVVAVRPAQAKMLVVDLDGTIVAEHLTVALLEEDGGRPIPGAAAALQSLDAAGWDIVYLTARPAELHLRNRRWLERHGFPRGPLFEGVLDADALRGGGDRKRGTLLELKRTFPDIAAGVGDRLSDLQAYAAAGLVPYLLVRPAWHDAGKLRTQIADLAGAPPGTQAVQDWRDVEDGLRRGAVFPREPLLRRLERR